MILSPENLASNSSQNYDSVKENLINGVITVDDKLGYLQVVKQDDQQHQNRLQPEASATYFARPDLTNSSLEGTDSISNP